MAKIIPFESAYRDDMIFCLLTAKNRLGRIPRINEDLLDIQKSYFDKGDMFWVALDDTGRVIGMVGTDTVSPLDIWLKRLYIMPSMKRNGIAKALLCHAERFSLSKGASYLHTRFNDAYTEAPLFYSACGFSEVGRSDGLRHFIKSLS